MSAKKPIVKDGKVHHSAAGIPVPDGWQPKFLEELARSGAVRVAAEAVGIEHKTAYRRRQTDPEFARQWAEAKAQFLALPREQQALVNRYQHRVAQLDENGRVMAHVPGTVIPDGWQDFFLELFNKTMLLGESCKATGISLGWLRDYRSAHPEFEAKIQEAYINQTEVLEQIAIRRAGEGSDRLLEFMLKSRKPEVYRENVHHEHEHTVSGGIEIELLDGRQPIEIEAARRREAARILLEENTIDATATDVPPVVEDDEDWEEEEDFDLAATG